MSRPGMDKPAERLTREKQFWVRVPIGAIFITTQAYEYIKNIEDFSTLSDNLNLKYLNIFEKQWKILKVLVNFSSSKYSEFFNIIFAMFYCFSNFKIKQFFKFILHIIFLIKINKDFRKRLKTVSIFLVTKPSIIWLFFTIFWLFLIIILLKIID